MSAEAQIDRSKLKIAIVVSLFNASITNELLAGAKDVLLDAGVTENQIDVYWAPGAFEIPQLVKSLEESKQYDGIVPLGCVVRGETPHFDYICQSVTLGLTQLAIRANTPVVFGVLMTENMDQAKARSGGQSHKGVEAAQALLKVIQTKTEIDKLAS